MSIDVTYYSFSPKRADAAWLEKGEEKTRTIRRGSPMPVPQNELTKIDKEIDAKFIPRFEAIRAKILTKLPKELSEYGIDSSDLRALSELGSEDDRIEYEVLRRQYSGAVMEAKQKLSREYYSKGLSEGLERDDLMHELVEMDLEFGGVSIWFEYPEFEDIFQRLFSEKFGITLVNDVLDRNGWIEFIKLSKEERDLFTEVVDAFAKEMDFSEDDAEAMLVDYLGSITPILKDLKTMDDALFYRDYGEEGHPAGVEKLLLTRAEQHVEKYRETLPSIRK